jgi:hypothetical protein
MEARGRSTDLLKVTERVYYLRLAPPLEAAAREPVSPDTRLAADDDPRGDEYLYLERITCCRDAAGERAFTDWYSRGHVAPVLQRDGFERATRYELYRVLMIEPQTATRYLTVYEFRAHDADDAARRMAAVRSTLRSAALQRGTFTESNSLLFRKIRDVRRPPAPGAQSENATR